MLGVTFLWSFAARMGDKSPHEIARTHPTRPREFRDHYIRPSCSPCLAIAGNTPPPSLLFEALLGGVLPWSSREFLKLASETTTSHTTSMADQISRAVSNGSVSSNKQTEQKFEHVPGSAPNDTNHLNVAHMTPEHRARVEKSLKRKLDLRCSLFVAIYIMNYLDRNNIAAARLKGLQDDLNLNNTEYSTCLSILYVGYILMQIPSNMLINGLERPSLYLSIVMLIWGLISTLSGVVHDFKGMVVTRFFLGFVEAAFLPGVLLILSKWYTRRELTLRNAILFCGNLISNAFSALVGAGVLSNMQGTLGHAAWRWLFWIEGAVTMVSSPQKHLH